jgi:hypothetical protein
MHSEVASENIWIKIVEAGFTGVFTKSRGLEKPAI